MNIEDINKKIDEHLSWDDEFGEKYEAMVGRAYMAANVIFGYSGSDYMLFYELRPTHHNVEFTLYFKDSSERRVRIDWVHGLDDKHNTNHEIDAIRKAIQEESDWFREVSK